MHTPTQDWSAIASYLLGPLASAEHIDILAARLRLRHGNSPAVALGQDFVDVEVDPSVRIQDGWERVGA